MFQRMILAALFIMSFDVNARNIKFDCSNTENHTLKMTIDESFLIGGSSAPGLADLKFILDGKEYHWKKTQYLSFAINPQLATTLFSYGPLEELYIEHSPAANEAILALTINMEDFEFECEKSFLFVE